MSTTRDNASRGFTLIELLVVIAIIAILAAILFPVFAQAREKARAITCISNEKQMGLGFLQYVQDNDEVFPRWQYDTQGIDDDTERNWPTSIYPYIKNGDTTVESIDNQSITYGSSGIFMCPDFPQPDQGTPYAVNLSMMQEGPDSNSPPGTMLPSANLSQIQTPADTVMLIETGVDDGDGSYYIFDPQEGFWTNTVGNPPGSVNGVHYDLQGPTGGGPAAIANGGYGGDCDATAAEIAANIYSYPGCGMFPRYRHTNTSNVLFSDGHAKAVVRGNLNWYKNIYIQGLYEESNSPVY
jgi:prepilin-type N-terminal cleavage/methylation domain-containing protein/prepilin-type processing-associated H-X9-DG protein